MRRYNEASSGQWNDKSEFATPNMLKQAQEQGYVIDTNNVNQVSTFNPFEVPQALLSAEKPAQHGKGGLGTSCISKGGLGGEI